MDSPSWTDAFHSAFSSCLHCFHSPSTESLHNDNQPAHNPPRPRHLEPLLEPLLTDPGDTDNEAETVSLHSNIGDTNNRRRNDRKRTKRRGISLFGFDLFGKRNGAIQLSESDDDDEYEALRRSRRSQRGLTSSRSLTFDGNISDAAPLDSAAIDERVGEEQEQLRAAHRQKEEKEERRRKRKEKKELKRLAQALAQNARGGELEFEGFQGSGDHIPSHSHPYPHIPSPFQQGFLQSPDPSPNPNVGFDDYGPFRGADAYDDDADFDGGLYAARKPKEGSSVSGGGSDSRRSPGETSASRSDHSQSPSPLPLMAAEPKTKKKSKKSSSNSNSSSATSSSKTKSNNSRSSGSATSSDQTPSLASPIYSPSPLSEGFALPMKEPALDYEGSEFPSPGLFNVDNRNFPSAGLGFGLSRSNSTQARSGAFLASRD